MQDSNEFHALALDTDPPIFCVNDASRALVALVVGYFPQAEAFRDPFGLFGAAGVVVKVVDGFDARVGDGPRGLGEEEALLGAQGLPKVLA